MENDGKEVMRRNIYDVLKNGRIDINKEYSRIYDLFYDKYLKKYNDYYALVDLVKDNFCRLNTNFIGRCQSLDDFNNSYGFNFTYPMKVNIEILIDISEYVFNFVLMLTEIQEIDAEISQKIQNHIESCMEDIGFKKLEKDSIVIFTESSPQAISVSEIVDDALSYSVLEYNHHRLKGNLNQKLIILKKMADDIETQRPKLKGLNKDFTDSLFRLINKFVRHNNRDDKFISQMKDDEIEEVYDNIYQMWLLAKLLLDNQDRREWLKGILGNI